MSPPWEFREALQSFWKWPIPPHFHQALDIVHLSLTLIWCTHPFSPLWWQDRLVETCTIWGDLPKRTPLSSCRPASRARALSNASCNIFGAYCTYLAMLPTILVLFILVTKWSILTGSVFSHTFLLVAANCSLLYLETYICRDSLGSYVIVLRLMTAWAAVGKLEKHLLSSCHTELQGRLSVRATRQVLM